MIQGLRTFRICAGSSLGDAIKEDGVEYVWTLIDMANMKKSTLFARRLLHISIFSKS
jgi:hypothetical protein